MRVHYPKLRNMVHTISFLNVFIAFKRSNLYILFAFTAAGVVPCDGLKKSPHTSSIVQIIFQVGSFEINKNIQSVRNTHV